MSPIAREHCRNYFRQRICYREICVVILFVTFCTTLLTVWETRSSYSFPILGQD